MLKLIEPWGGKGESKTENHGAAKVKVKPKIMVGGIDRRWKNHGGGIVDIGILPTFYQEC